VVRREPGEGTLGKWLVCVVIAFILVAAIKSYL
jgi:hypothetical protein